MKKNSLQQPRLFPDYPLVHGQGVPSDAAPNDAPVKHEGLVFTATRITEDDPLIEEEDAFLAEVLNEEEGK